MYNMHRYISCDLQLCLERTSSKELNEKSFLFKSYIMDNFQLDKYDNRIEFTCYMTPPYFTHNLLKGGICLSEIAILKLRFSRHNMPGIYNVHVIHYYVYVTYTIVSCNIIRECISI